MPHYRVYVLDEHGQLEGVLDVDDWSPSSNLTIRGTDPSVDEAPSHPRAKID
jgi:hypothetical protein